MALVVMAACAPKLAPLPTVSLPRFPDFIAPVVPQEFAGTLVVENQTRGVMLSGRPLPALMHEILDAGGIVNFVKDRKQA